MIRPLSIASGAVLTTSFLNSQIIYISVCSSSPSSVIAYTSDPMRPVISCHACRRGKRKCHRPEGMSPGTCRPCKERNIECSFSQNDVRRPARLESVGAITSRRPEDSLDFLTEAAINSLVSDYLNFIHDKSHSLFHLSTLWSHIKARTISKSLLYSLCAMGSRISLDKEVHDNGRRCFLAAKALFLADFANVNLQNVQTSILLANLSAFELDTASEALFFSKSISGGTATLLNS